MYIDKSNEVLMNHYRKQEIIKANERIKEGIPIIKVLQLADKKFITTGVAKKIKEDYLLCKKTDKIFNLNESVIRKYGKEKNLKIVFNEYEVDKYFAGIPKRNIKEHILKALNSSYKNQL